MKLSCLSFRLSSISVSLDKLMLILDLGEWELDILPSTNQNQFHFRR